MGIIRWCISRREDEGRVHRALLLHYEEVASRNVCVRLRLFYVDDLILEMCITLQTAARNIWGESKFGYICNVFHLFI